MLRLAQRGAPLLALAHHGAHACACGLEFPGMHGEACCKGPVWSARALFLDHAAWPNIPSPQTPRAGMNKLSCQRARAWALASLVEERPRGAK
eukprot:9493607-Pyramimonas_sp.AAC.1